MKKQETVIPNEDTQRQTANYAAHYAAHTGGREYTHNVDGIRQYPDLVEFSPANMTGLTILTNLELRKHS